MATKEKTGQQTMEMKNSEFHQFFMDELKDIYWAELHLVKALPKMKKAATSTELSAAFDKHTQETQTHADKLEQAFRLLGEEPKAKKCAAMEGLIDEANDIIDDTEKETMTRDAGLILAAQKIEHYEIATYGTLRVYAETMGHQDVAEILTSILENEKATDVALTKISESFVNEPAAKE
jgi:ferritin-like metal-binding protein YciE